MIAVELDSQINCPNCLIRYMVTELPTASALADSGIVLASVIMETSTVANNKDEFFLLGHGMTREKDVETGQNMGFYGMVTKGTFTCKGR